MIDRPAIATLIPHAGAMVLLDRVVAWDAGGIRCGARSHLDPLNPLRRDGKLSATSGVEYALQAAALHGALLAGGVAQRAGYLARLRAVVLHADHLDDGEPGDLVIEARLERQEANGMVYKLRVMAHDGRTLVTASASIALPVVA